MGGPSSIFETRLKYVKYLLLEQVACTPGMSDRGNVSDGKTGRIVQGYYKRFHENNRRKSLKKNKKKKKKKSFPGSITKVRGAAYSFPIIGKVNELNVHENGLKNQIEGVNDNGRQRKQKKSPKKSKNTKKKRVVAKNDVESLQTFSVGPVNVEKVFSSKRNDRYVDLNIGEDYNIPPSKKVQFRKTIEAPLVELTKLRKLSWGGIPYEDRGLIWKYLVGFYPCRPEKRGEMVKRRKAEYEEFVKKYCFEIKEEYEDDEDEDDEHSLTEFERKQRFQIKIDVPRTNPEIRFFHSNILQNALGRVLNIWSSRHPASGYVQGMNDILSIFFVVLLCDKLKVYNLNSLTEEDIEKNSDKIKDIEFESYWVFNFFINTIQDHYTHNQPGIHRMVEQVQDVIKKIDFELYNHVNRNNLQFVHVFFRWINCLMMRELSLKLIIRIFDTFLSEGANFETLHIFVCAAFLKNFSNELKKLNEAEFVMFIQNLPTDKWTFREVDMLLSQAYILMNLYK